MKKISVLLLMIASAICVPAQNRYDVVIDEVMADPSPPVGLPANEWIEITNTSTTTINLLNWRIGDATSQSGPMPSFVLQPGAFVIICAASAVSTMSTYGNVISVTSFPSLDNDGDVIYLKSNSGMIIHAVNYSIDWYKNDLKKDGGWSLEMIDVNSSCVGKTNWTASTDISGGTPGRINAITAITNDTKAPGIKNAFAPDRYTIVIVFDETVDSSAASAISKYSIDGGIIVTHAMPLPPLFHQVQLKTTIPLADTTVYTITARDIADCKGNSLITTARVGWPSDATKGEWIVNEILFNPRTAGYDYVELYNNSNKILDAHGLYIANRNSSGIISSIKAISNRPYYIFPKEYIVITEDAGILAMNYHVKNPEQVFTIASPPSFPDDGGAVVALNSQGEVVDEVQYNHNWHFKLLDNEEGVALERIDPSALSQDASNWHSAASSAGYGTPTYINSQYKKIAGSGAVFEITPSIFSPDNDGRDDILTIHYQLPLNGYVMNVTIFDAMGRMVKNLVRNAIAGINGYFIWDGLDDRMRRLPIGAYIVFTEIFNLQGKREIFKEVITLAGRR